ncbi:MAG: phosphohydrolase [Pseudomonadota bacterium]
MGETIEIIDHSEWVEHLFEPYRQVIGPDFPAYRGHVYRTITYAMHFLNGAEEHRKMVETVFVYHDIGLWTAKDLAYLEPSEDLALTDNRELRFGLDPETLRAAIHWHHKVTPYKGPNADLVNAVRKGDWIDASQGMVRHGLSKAQIAAVTAAIDDHGFPQVLQRLAKDIRGSTLFGNLRVLRRVFKW